MPRDHARFAHDSAAYENSNSRAGGQGPCARLRTKPWTPKAMVLVAGSFGTETAGHAGMLTAGRKIAVAARAQPP